jgi:carbonyl reductase 1
MMTKVAVVTGSNKGIGYAVVKLLLEKFDGDVFLTSRDSGRGEEAVKSLGGDKKKKLKFHQLDIDDKSSIEKLRDDLKDAYGGIDVLVNNAAIAYKNASTVPNVEQAENTINTNYFSVKNTCDILFPILKPGARVVNVSSSAGMLCRVPGEHLKQKLASDDLTREQLDELAEAYKEDVRNNVNKEKGWPQTNYSVSKVLLTALTRIQQREMDQAGKDVVVNACHPGYVDTDMTSHMGPLSPEEGAACPTFLALLPAGEDAPRGQMFWKDCTQVDWMTDSLPS